MSLLDNQMLPYFVQSMREMQELLNAEQMELERMQQEIRNQEKQLCINSSDEKLYRYEQCFALDSAGLSLNERRKNVIAKLNARITATKQNLLFEIQKMTGNPVEIQEFFDRYLFTVGLVQNNLSDAFVKAVRDYLDIIKPAHLAYDLSLIRYDETSINLGGGVIMSSIMCWEVI